MCLRDILDRLVLVSESAMIRAPHSLGCGQVGRVPRTRVRPPKAKKDSQTASPRQQNHYDVVNLMNAAQCKMARAALGWGVRDLATAAQVSTQTVTRFERGDRLKEPTIDILRSALEAAGIEFIPENGGGAGVRFRKPSSGE